MYSTTATGTVTIDRPVSYDIYRNVHKGIREELFAVTVELGRLDPDDAAAGLAVAGRFDQLLALLARHANHEDQHLDGPISAALPGRASELAAAHVLLEARMDHVRAVLGTGVGAVGPDRRAAFHAAYLEMAAFVADYLQHQDDEERIVMRALDARFSRDELAEFDGRIVASIAPEVMAQFLTIMLPAMNVLDRAELLAEIRAQAPAEAFAGVWGLASAVLAPADVAALDRRLGGAVNGTVQG